MSGGGSADPPPPQWPDGGESLLSLLRNPTNLHHNRRSSHPHNNNPPSASASTQHFPFAVHQVPLDQAVSTVGPAIVPVDVHDRLSPPSQRSHPQLIYPHNFASRPAVPNPNPNQQLVHTGGDLGGTDFVGIRLPHQFQQRDLSVGSLGFGLADGISSDSLRFDRVGEHQVRSLGVNHHDRAGRYQESWNLYSQGISSMNEGVSPLSGYQHQNKVDSHEREKQNYGKVHRMRSAVAVDRMNGGRGEREFGNSGIGFGFEGTGEKRGTRYRNRYRESSDEDNIFGNGSGDMRLSQELNHPGLPSGSIVRSIPPVQSEEFRLGGRVPEDGIERGNEGQKEKEEDLNDLDEKLNGIVVGEDGIDQTNDKKQSRHFRDKDFRSDPRGQQMLSQKARVFKRFMECRWDIDKLSTPFLALYEFLIPTEEEKVKQKQLLTFLEKLVNKEWPEARLYLYGSCGNSFGVCNSDIDVCLEIQGEDIDRSELLLKLADILQSDNLQEVKALTRARVPIVKLMDPVTGISCDVCVNNMLAVVNTKLLRDYAQIDVRLRQLVYIVKHWAKSRSINETYRGTLSSYAYVLMCIHFLQQQRPPILPCLQEMDPTYSVTVDDITCSYFDQVEKLSNFGSRNKESIAQLVWAFFNHWAYRHDYTNMVISVRTGHLLRKQSKDWTRRIGNDRHLICIEDPFDTSHDLGRVVNKFSIWVLREEFERAAHIMQHDPNPFFALFEPYIPPE